MMNWLNILAIAYLAAAPGMNVGRLIHAVNLCQFADPAGHQQAVQAEHPCPHHAPAPEPEPDPEPQDCPHIHSVAPHVTAMPAAQLEPMVSAGLPVLNLPATAMPSPASASKFIEDAPRPPPGPPLVGTIILLV